MSIIKKLSEAETARIISAVKEAEQVLVFRKHLDAMLAFVKVWDESQNWLKPEWDASNSAQQAHQDMCEARAVLGEKP